MSLKKNRQSLRGLSHQEKVKKLEKFTRVPLQNLKTNIAQSDLQEDDVQVPICLRLSTNHNESAKNQFRDQWNSKRKVFDQQTINKTIRAMTKQLYSLELQKQQQRIHAQQNQQASISIFSIEDFSFDIGLNPSKGRATKEALDDFYSTSKNQQSTNSLKRNELSQISKKVSNKQNISFVQRQKIENRKNLCCRQTEPIFNHQEIQPTKNLFSPKLDLTKKNELMQSKVSKRFSRTKRDSEQLKELKIEKKPKFNRSNQKNRVLNQVIDKENKENIYIAKAGLLTERLSYQSIPTCETLETGLKKRKNIGRNFITFQKQNAVKDVNFQQYRNLSQKGMTLQKKNSLNRVISQFEEISKNQLFKLLQQGNTRTFLQNENAANFVHKLFRKYQQSMGLLKSLQ